MKSPINRRHFLMGSAAVAAAGTLTGRATASPNDTVRIACVGVRGRGKDHILGFAHLPNVEIVALCDVDESVLNERSGDVEKLKGKRPTGYGDLRKLLEDKSIDAISIASPNHWHSLQAIWAMQAGKDVYVEKPCSHNVFETQQIVAAQQKYNRIVQHGTQSRSSAALREGMQKLHEGVIGDVYMARGIVYKWRNTIGRTPVSSVPKGVDYDQWLGPAPLHEFTKNRFHYNWHWFWDYGNGDIGNQGVHEMDVARWGLGVTHPDKVSAIGGHFMFDDDQETPNTLAASFEFDGTGSGNSSGNAKRKMMTFEVRHWMTNGEGNVAETKNDSNAIGIQFYGSLGYLTVDSYDSYQIFMGRKHEPQPKVVSDGDHFANFIAAVRNRKQDSLNAPIAEGALSTQLVHLANISYRVGRTLQFDAASMTCKGDSEANALLTRNYRAPYVVPAIG